MEEWYEWRRTVLGREGEKKRVYLASDDVTVLNATIKMYDLYSQWGRATNMFIMIMTGTQTMYLSVIKMYQRQLVILGEGTVKAVSMEWCWICSCSLSVTTLCAPYLLRYIYNTYYK